MRSLLPVVPTLFVLVPFVCGLAPANEVSGAKLAAPLSASMPDGDAAARHAKRTACLKDAKARKLVGAQKAAFLRECFAAR